jgi:hypothetical protein
MVQLDRVAPVPDQIHKISEWVPRNEPPRAALVRALSSSRRGFFFERPCPQAKRNNPTGIVILFGCGSSVRALNRRAGCPYAGRVEMEMGGHTMGPKFVFMALSIAFGVAVALATATTIRQVHLATSSIAHPVART